MLLLLFSPPAATLQPWLVLTGAVWPMLIAPAEVGTVRAAGMPTPRAPSGSPSVTAPTFPVVIAPTSPFVVHA